LAGKNPRTKWRFEWEKHRKYGKIWEKHGKNTINEVF
jgi:hypothetical protein